MPSKTVMHRWKQGDLHSGSKKGPVVRKQKQAVAIMLSEKRNEKKHGGKYKHAKKSFYLSKSLCSICHGKGIVTVIFKSDGQERRNQRPCPICKNQGMS